MTTQTQNTNALGIIKRMRRKEVAAVLGCSPSTLRDKLAAGEFIAPTYEGKTPYWLSTEVYTWVNDFFNKDSAA